MFFFLVKELHKKTEWMYMKVGYTKKKKGSNTKSTE